MNEDFDSWDAGQHPRDIPMDPCPEVKVAVGYEISRSHGIRPYLRLRPKVSSSIL